MKRRLQSLSIWPVSPSPVKGNRLAEQRHYIIICRCRRARQKREGTHGTLGERKGLWHPSLSHLGWHSTMGEKYTHTHTHRLWPCCSGRAKTREARENRKVEEKWDLSLPSFFSPSHFRFKKKDSLKEKRKCICGEWYGEEEGKEKDLSGMRARCLFVVTKCLCRRGGGQWLG